MSQQRHVIKRQTVEITLAKKEDAWPIQQTLSRIFQQHFPAILDRCLSEFSHPDCLQRIDRLELDLGELDASRLEAEILDSIEVTLRQALHEFITPPQFPSTVKQQADPMQAHLELFEHFVREGCLPWWADSTQSHMPEKSFTALQNNDPQTLTYLLIKLIQEPRCLQRLINYFGDGYLVTMTVLITAASKELATSLLQTLQAVQASLHQFSGVPVLRLRATLWQSLLQVAIAGEPPVFRHAEFLTAVTARWARLQGISHKALVSCIQQLSASSSAINNPWLQAIKPGTQTDQRFATFAAKVISKRYKVLKKQHTEQAQLANELSSAIKPAEKVNEPISHDSGVDLSSVKLSPEGQIWSRIERTQSSGQNSQETLDLVTTARMQEVKQSKVQLPRENKNKEKIQSSPFDAAQGRLLPKREGSRFPKSTALISHEHQPAPAIISKRYALLKKWFNLHLRQPPKPPSEPVAEDMNVAPSHPQPARKIVESQRLNKPSAKQNIFLDDQTTGMEPTDDKQTLNDTDALYINNAGLCILWPFLVPFFERLELVEDGRFHSLAAKQCAVSLLHYLATEELKPPEYWLPFNKLLCGISIDEVFDCATLLTTTQIEACDELLSAVINNAPILNNISLNGFRGSFLLRHGVLSAGPGSWLLRVERETYDLVLDRFPWSWQWLKLPWMEYPLRVEW
ncbi:MAG: contractile injection system tape measure protein [Methylobacter sp.]